MSWPGLSWAGLCVYMCVYVHVCMLGYGRLCVYVWMCVCTPKVRSNSAQLRSSPPPHVHTHMYTHTHVHIHMHTHTHMHIHMHMRPRTHACMSDGPSMPLTSHPV